MLHAQAKRWEQQCSAAAADVAGAMSGAKTANDAASGALLGKEA